MITQEKLKSLFWSKVDIRGPDECWNWTASSHPHGYGKFKAGSNNGLSNRAHRVAWTLSRGDPGDLQVLHTCDNPPCCNPSHLRLGTHQDNMDDMRKRGRHGMLGKHPSPETREHLRLATRGKNNPSSKIEESEIHTIRDSQEAVKVLANRYGVSKVQIYNIKKKKSWRHL